MSIQRVALIFDNTVRPDTTGVHCRRALGELVEVEHFLPSDLGQIPTGKFDLHLNIDDGLRYRFPERLRPSAWWAIDTHMDFEWYRTKAPDFDLVFAAQRDGAERLSREVCLARWLPLACDPQVHRRRDVAKRFDVAFVGSMVGRERLELLRLLEEQFPETFVGQCYGEAMAEVYSAARTVFNRSIRNDINMRVFEAIACGSLLVTNDLSDNGQAELFRDGEHLVVYRDAGDLVERIRWYLGHEESREQIAAAGRDEVLRKHTYRHRMETLLDAMDHRLAQTSASPSVPHVAGPRSRSYFEFSRPELLALIPRSAQQILDVGCGAGMLGAALKARREAVVHGIELDAGAAVAAATRLDHVLVGDIEQLEPDFADGQFDAIVCGDILEHLRDPERFLRRARRWLKPDGVLVASLPNVRHVSVIEGLLDGDWTYEAAGLLDRDHLRFFTRQEIERLLRETGFALVTLDIVPGPGYSEWVSRGRPPAAEHGRLCIRDLPPQEAEEFFVYQYLVTAVPLKGEYRGLACSGPEGTVSPGTVGCILAVQNRPVASLRWTLETYEYQTFRPADQVLVDYGSDSAMAAEYQVLCEQYRWQYVRIDPQRPGLNLSIAYNQAVAALDKRVDVVFKNDLDVLLGGGVLEAAAKRARSTFCIFTCFSTEEGASYPDHFASPEDLTRLLRSHRRPFIMDGEGVHAFPRKWFEAVGGYDAQFEHWGYDDSDLRLRAQWTIGVVRIQDLLLIHQWHPRQPSPDTVHRNHAYYQRMKRAGLLVRNDGHLLGDSGCGNAGTLTEAAVTKSETA